jgi:nascent polypeptide-associated complex subunit alpha
MFPGVNKRQMDQMMRKMGIAQQDIEAEQVIIRCKDKDIILDNPQVSKVNMMGQKTYQIVGQEHEKLRETSIDVSEEDIKTVMEQAGVDKIKAKEALLETKGDIAEAIMNLTEDELDSKDKD